MSTVLVTDLVTDLVTGHARQEALSQWGGASDAATTLVAGAGFEPATSGL